MAKEIEDTAAAASKAEEPIKGAEEAAVDNELPEAPDVPGKKSSVYKAVPPFKVLVGKKRVRMTCVGVERMKTVDADGKHTDVRGNGGTLYVCEREVAWTDAQGEPDGQKVLRGSYSKEEVERE